MCINSVMTSFKNNENRSVGPTFIGKQMCSLTNNKLFVPLQ
jgi:hypothetical protein